MMKAKITTQTIKENQDNVLYFLRILFIPAKGSDTLSLHQRTITYCLWTILALLFSTILIETHNSSNHWFNFIENLMIGIICSAVVVVITVALQFKAEQENRIKKHNSSAYCFLSCVKECLFQSEIPHEKEQYLLDSLFEQRDRYVDFGLGIRWYSAKEVREYFDVVLHILPLFMPLYESNSLLSIADYRKKVTAKMYNDAVNAAIVFSANYVLTDTKNRFEELRHEQEQNQKTGDIL